jgi:hypothetical protein
VRSAFWVGLMLLFVAGVVFLLLSCFAPGAWRRCTQLA